MENNPYYKLIEESGIYPREVVKLWGEQDKFWAASPWHERERSLRHDFGCILMCNLETYNPLVVLESFHEFTPAPKRVRTSEYGESSGSGASRSDCSNVSTAPNELIAGTEHDPNLHRYLLIEGMPGEERFISDIVHTHGLIHPGHAYDIFDQKEKMWIEVKITRDLEEAYELYLSTINPRCTTGFIHIDPETITVTVRGITESPPGLGKAVEFLLNRRSELQVYLEGRESELMEDDNMNFKVFPCARFNESVDKWVASFWDKRKDAQIDSKIEIPEAFKNKPFNCLEMAEYIEDTRLREAPLMQFKGKVLPPLMSDSYPTEFEKDSEIIDEFFSKYSTKENLTPEEKLYNKIKDLWITGDKSTFCLVSKGNCEKEHHDIAEALGIGAKASVRDDSCPDLMQEDFSNLPKARYSSWMDELMVKLSRAHPYVDEISYSKELSDIEVTSTHPLGKEMQDIRSAYFKLFGKSRIGEYCSKIKNTYSRLGGAYLERTQKGTHNSVTVFPILATGTDGGGGKRRLVSGFCLRGPHHAKKATDRISLLTFEIMEKGRYGKRFATIIKKAHKIEMGNGDTLIYRQNSVNKQDPSFLAFVHNATYLAGNFLGEIVMRSSTTMRNHSSLTSAIDMIDGCGQWLMERVTESVLMAIIGSSQEEGAFAIIRKIFMAMVAKRGGDTPYNRDWRGLGEALNECLGDSALALYWAHQTRESLIVLGRN